MPQSAIGQTAVETKERIVFVASDSYAVVVDAAAIFSTPGSDK